MTNDQFQSRIISYLHSIKIWNDVLSISSLPDAMDDYILPAGPDLYGYWCTLSGSTKRITALEITVDMAEAYAIHTI